jgi:cAMP-dependent protein kinase regulator
MIDYLKENHGNRESINEQEKTELNFLRVEVPKMRNNAGGNSDVENVGSEIESDDSDEDEYVEPLPKNKLPQKVKRVSVSAEAYGTWNKKGDFKPTIVQKTEEIKKKIELRLTQAFMFSALEANEKNIVVDAMKEINVETGTRVIEQGGDGEDLYVVESGSLDCFKLFSGNTEETHLKTYVSGDSFGELALLYNAPRAATIIAKEDCLLWSLDRNTFNHIVKDAAAKKRERYEDFLGSVDILSGMEHYERIKLADGLKEEQYHPSEYVIREGDAGDIFYFI